MSFFTNLRADRLITEIRSSSDPASPDTQKAVARLKDLGAGAIESVFAREVLIGFLIGLLCGGVTLAFAAIMHINLHLGLVVGVAMVCALCMSTSMATIMPVVLKRYGVDPAVAAGDPDGGGADVAGLA